MAQRGLCSRREADSFIERGWIFVDGERVTQLGTKIDPEQKIELDPRARRRQSRLVTVLLNKPVGYVSSRSEKGYPLATSLVTPERLFSPKNRRKPKQIPMSDLAPAGRLDIDSQGLLVLTQDGRIARRLIGPDGNVEKEYVVRVRGEIDRAKLARLRGRLLLDGRALKPIKVTQVGKDRLRFILTEGRKRQVRRMCQLVDLEVLSLKRLRIGKVRLHRLPLGKWRFLDANESF